jgi:hypothetical protein
LFLQARGIKKQTTAALWRFSMLAQDFFLGSTELIPSSLLKVIHFYNIN